MAQSAKSKEQGAVKAGERSKVKGINELNENNVLNEPNVLKDINKPDELK